VGLPSIILRLRKLFYLKKLQRTFLSTAFTKRLSKDVWSDLMKKYPPIKGMKEVLVAPTMETGTREYIKQKFGYHKTKEVFTSDDGLVEKQAPFLAVARPIAASLDLLEGPLSPDESEDDINGPHPDEIKAYLEDALVLLRILKDDIPTDKHLFPDKFRQVVQSEHDHSQTNSKVIGAPSKPQFRKATPTQPFRAFSGPSAGHIGSGFEGSSTSGCRTGGPVPFNLVHSTAGEKEPTSFQPEDIEQIYPRRKVQTRKYGPSKNTVETERLSNETGPEGCLLLCTSSSGTQEVPSISFSRWDLRVPVFTLRSIISTPSLHETGQASYCNSENIWHTSSDIFGRPTALPPGSNRVTDNLQDCNHPTHRRRVYHQTREVLTITHASNHLSGGPAELDGHDNSCSSGETLPHTVGVQRDPDQGVVLHAGTFSIAGSNESDCPNWNSGSTFALSNPSTDAHCGYTQERSLHTIKAVPDSSNEGSILRTQVVVFGATKSNQPDGVEPFTN
ncbi:Hypothetical predicted protein, partial [Paramuricea clavata]